MNDPVQICQDLIFAEKYIQCRCINCGFFLNIDLSVVESYIKEKTNIKQSLEAFSEENLVIGALADRRVSNNSSSIKKEISFKSPRNFNSNLSNNRWLKRKPASTKAMHPNTDTKFTFHKTIVNPQVSRNKINLFTNLPKKLNMKKKNRRTSSTIPVTIIDLVEEQKASEQCDSSESFEMVHSFPNHF